MHQPEDLLTAGEAARMLHVSTDTVRRWANAGRLPVRRTPYGHRRFLLADVQAALEVSEPKAAS